MWIWKSKCQQIKPVNDGIKLYQIKLHHNNGNTEITLSDITDYRLKILKNILGRDKIFDNGDVVINTKDFIILEVIS